MKHNRLVKQIKWIGLLLLFIPLLSGCWDRLEIEERAVVLGLSIDLAPNQIDESPEDVAHHPSFPMSKLPRIKITVQIAVPGRIPLGPDTGGGGGAGEQKPVWIVEAEGNTIDDAIVNLQQQMANELFLGHLRVIVISEAVARKVGVGNLNDFFRRNSEIRRTAWMVVAKGKAEQYMKTSPELERVPALYLQATMDHAVKLGELPNDFLGIFWSAVSSKGKSGYLPYIELKENNNFKISGIAYFSKYKMKGRISPLQTGMYMAILGISQGGYSVYAKVPVTSAVVMFRATSRKNKIVVKMKNGKPYFHIMIRLEGDLDEDSKIEVPLNKEETLNNIEKSIKQSAEAGHNALLDKMQKEGIDIFGFGEHVRAKQWRYWNSEVKTKEKWMEQFKDVSIEVEVKILIRRVGMMAM